MTIASFRTAFATACRTITDMRASEYITDQVTAPQVMFDLEIEPDLTFGRGADVYRVTGWVLASRTAAEASQKFLDLIRDPNTTGGLKYTLENDSTLGGACDYARVTRIGRIQPTSHEGTEYLGFDFDVEVVI